MDLDKKVEEVKSLEQVVAQQKQKNNVSFYNLFNNVMLNFMDIVVALLCLELILNQPSNSQ